MTADEMIYVQIIHPSAKYYKRVGKVYPYTIMAVDVKVYFDDGTSVYIYPMYLRKIKPE